MLGYVAEPLLLMRLKEKANTLQVSFIVFAIKGSPLELGKDDSVKLISSCVGSHF